MATMGDRIRELRDRDRFSLEKFGAQFGVSREMVGQWERNESAPKHSRQKDIAEKYSVSLDWLSGKEEPPVALHSSTHPRQTVAVAARNDVALSQGEKRTALYEALTEPVFLIGQVQAGAWVESYQLPEGEWKRMDLPADPDYPGVTRYALRNVGESMNNECEDGGTWVFVQLIDLVGIGPQPGNYVIVERIRVSGEIEATCKKLGVLNGQLWLLPDSRDPSFEPIPIGGVEGEEIVVRGIVTDVINRPGRGR